MIFLLKYRLDSNTTRTALCDECRSEKHDFDFCIWEMLEKLFLSSKSALHIVSVADGDEVIFICIALLELADDKVESLLEVTCKTGLYKACAVFVESHDWHELERAADVSRERSKSAAATEEVEVLWDEEGEGVVHALVDSLDDFILALACVGKLYSLFNHVLMWAAECAGVDNCDIFAVLGHFRSGNRRLIRAGKTVSHSDIDDDIVFSSRVKVSKTVADGRLGACWDMTLTDDVYKVQGADFVKLLISCAVYCNRERSDSKALSLASKLEVRVDVSAIIFIINIPLSVVCSF